MQSVLQSGLQSALWSQTLSAAPSEKTDTRARCPACGLPGIERHGKWICDYCGLIIETCCEGFG